jgi:hypothetical protein
MPGYETTKKALRRDEPLQGFCFPEWVFSLKGHLKIGLVQVHHQDDKQQKVDEKPHHEFALFAFVFYMIRHFRFILIES